MKVEDIIEELILIIHEQNKELKEARQELSRIKKYVEVYERIIKGE